MNTEFWFKKSLKNATMCIFVGHTKFCHEQNRGEEQELDIIQTNLVHNCRMRKNVTVTIITFVVFVNPMMQ